MQQSMLSRAFYAAPARQQYKPARCGSPSVSSARVLAVASRSRTLRRIAGDRGARQRCSALSQKLARKPSEPPRAPPCAASKLCTILPINFQARKPRLLPRPRQETQLFTSSRRRRQTDRAKPLGSRAGPKSSPTTRWKSPASNRRRRADSARAAAPRPGRALGVESKFRIACAPFRAQAFTRNPKTTFRGFARNRSRGPQGRISATIDTKNAGHGQLPHARPADELQDETHDATTRQAARLRRAVGLAHGR